MRHSKPTGVSESNRRISPELDALLTGLVGEERHRIYQNIGRAYPHTIRFNPLKGDVSAQAALLQEEGFQFEPHPALPNVFRIRFQPFPIGKSLSHFLGHIYVQDLSSMIPPLVLDPQPGEQVLDLSAAPGSKTTQMAALMANQGVVVANDVAMKRLRGLMTNLERMGVINTAVFKWYGEQYGNAYFEQFDRVLVDPACSGLGTLHKNPEVLGWWTPAHCDRLSRSQRSLLISAIKAVRPGGVVVYSTCTLTPQENEAVVSHVLAHYPVELETISLPGLASHPGLTAFEGQGFHPQLERAIRIYPFENESEGFFVARLRKTEAMPTPSRHSRTKSVERLAFLTAHTAPAKKYLDYLCRHFGIPEKALSPFRFLMGKSLYVVSAELAAFPFQARPLQMGLMMAHLLKQAAKLTTGGAHLLGPYATRQVVDLPDLASVQGFVNRQPLNLTVEGRGQVLVRYRGSMIGYGLVEAGRLKSQFPKAEWPFHLVKQDPEETGEQG